MTSVTKPHNFLTSKSKIRLSNKFLEESNVIVRNQKHSPKRSIE